MQDHSRRSPGDPLQGIVQEFHDYGTNKQGEQVFGTSARRVELPDHASGMVDQMFMLPAIGATLATSGVGAAGYQAYRWYQAGRSQQPWSVPRDVKDKFPESWGAGVPNKKGVGERWQDPANPGNGVRVDQGNPLNSQVVQQVDHVVVRSDGRVIGRDGQPIQGSIRDNPEAAHIPVSEYRKWETWFSPTK
jgi:hypothetical protein